MVNVPITYEVINRGFSVFVEHSASPLVLSFKWENMGWQMVNVQVSQLYKTDLMISAVDSQLSHVLFVFSFKPHSCVRRALLLILFQRP